MRLKLYTFAAKCADTIVNIEVVASDYNNAFVAAAEKSTHYGFICKRLDFVSEVDAVVSVKDAA